MYNFETWLTNAKVFESQYIYTESCHCHEQREIRTSKTFTYDLLI